MPCCCLYLSVPCARPAYCVSVPIPVTKLSSKRPIAGSAEATRQAARFSWATATGFLFVGALAEARWRPPVNRNERSLVYSGCCQDTIAYCDGNSILFPATIAGQARQAPFSMPSTGTDSKARIIISTCATVATSNIYIYVYIPHRFVHASTRQASRYRPDTKKKPKTKESDGASTGLDAVTGCAWLKMPGCSYNQAQP